MRLGFAGLGNMGRPMARNLVAAGHDVFVFDIAEHAANALVAEGAKRVETLEEMANRVEIACISLPTPDVVEKVLTAEDGLGRGKIRIIVDFSTTGPAVAEKVAAELEKRNICLLDAPVSGGTTGAEAGTLAIMLSGKEAAYLEVVPALEAVGKNLFYLGDRPGAAHLMKLINNTIMATTTIASFEGLVLGAKAGLDAQTMLDVIKVSSGQSFAISNKIQQCVVDRSFPHRFSTALLDKDIRLCLSEGERLGVSMPTCQQARQFIAFGISQGYAELDFGHLIKILEGWAGAQFGTEQDMEQTT